MSDRHREPGWYKMPDGSDPKYWDGFRWTDRKWRDWTPGAWQVVSIVALSVAAILWLLISFLRTGFGMLPG